MPSLYEFQQDFKHKLFDKPEGKLRIYKNNIFITFTQALRDIYTAIEKLVGEKCFKGLAREYIIKHPSLSGNLQDYGRDFAEFLSQYELPYLPDMARVAWCYYDLCHAEEGAYHIVHSPFPIFSIWSLCQKEEGEEKIDLAKGGEQILIMRENLDIVVIKVS